MENWTEAQIVEWINKTTLADSVLAALNAKDDQSEVTLCRECGIGILRNFAVLLANYEEGWTHYADPEATYYHRNCWRVMKRAQKAKMSDVSPIPKWDALKSWFASEEVAAFEQAGENGADSPAPMPSDAEDEERRKENASVFALADKDWHDAGWN